MVIRYLIKCNTCHAPMTLRIWVGHNPLQQHAFLCPNCSEETAVRMEVNVDELSTNVLCYENCVEGDAEGPIINLNPHFVLSETTLTEDRSFHWMEQAQYIQRTSGIGLSENLRKGSGPIVVDSYEMLGGISNVTDLWRTIRKGWTLHNNGKTELSLTILKGYAPEGYDSAPTIPNVLYDFCLRLLLPVKVRLVRDGFELLKNLRDNERDNLLEFRAFYLEKLRKDHLDRFFTIVDEYFRDYTEFEQTILYVKNEAPVPEGCIATSTGFRSTRMFYGNAYELYTSNLVTLACLNNIAAGRPYDKFASMDLKKYLTINKAKRGDPFEDNPLVAPFLRCLDSTFRNASHHGAANLKNHHRTIEFRSGGTGARREIAYSRYLEMCGEIFLSAAALATLELMLAT